VCSILHINKKEEFNIGSQLREIDNYTNDSCQFDNNYKYNSCHANLLFEDIITKFINTNSVNRRNINLFIYQYIIGVIRKHLEELKEGPIEELENKIIFENSDDIRCAVPEDDGVPDLKGKKREKINSIELEHDLQNVSCKMLWTDFWSGNQGAACKIGQLINKDRSTAFAIEQSMLPIPILTILGDWYDLMGNLKRINGILSRIHTNERGTPIGECSIEDVANGMWAYTSYSFAKLNLDYAIILIPYDSTASDASIPDDKQFLKTKVLFSNEIPNSDSDPNKKYMFLNHDYIKSKFCKNFDKNHMDYNNVKINNSDFVTKAQLLDLIINNLGKDWIKTFDLNDITFKCH